MTKDNIFGAIVALVLVAALCCTVVLATSTPKVPRNSSVACDPSASSALLLSHSVLEMSLEGPIGVLRPMNVTERKALQWSSSDPSVVEVHQGRLHPVSVGTAVVSCTDGVDTAYCSVIVNEADYKVYELDFATFEQTVSVGDTGVLDCCYIGPGAVTMYSNHPEIVQVEHGTYKALSAGRAIIICTDGLYHTTCQIFVTESGTVETESSPGA